VSKLGEVVEVDGAPFFHWVGGNDICAGGVPVEWRARGPDVCYILLARVHTVQSFPLFLQLHLLFLPPFFFKHDGLEIRDPSSAVLPSRCGGNGWE